MARAANCNWGKSDQPVVPTITEFEKTCIKLNLQPDQFLRSEPLRQWASANRNIRYVPEPLLEAWGFSIEMG